MDKLTGISEPTVTLPIGMDCRDIPKGFMSVLEFRQVAGPIEPEDIAWAKEVANAMNAQQSDRLEFK